MPKTRPTLEDTVTVICYGQTEKMTRREAVRKYYEAMRNSEGSERDRYCTVYFQLVDGETECSDTE